MDRESALLDQIKSAQPDEIFPLDERLAFKVAEKGRSMTLKGLCASNIIQEAANFIKQPEIFLQLPACLVQLLYDGCGSRYSKMTDSKIGLVSALIRTGRLTKLRWDVADNDLFYCRTDAVRSFGKAINLCPKLQQLDGGFDDICLSLENSCVIHNIGDRECPERLGFSGRLITFPLEKLQHLTKLSFEVDLKWGDSDATWLINVIRALPVLKFLDSNVLSYRHATPHFVSLVQPLLAENQRVLEVEALSVCLSHLTVDLNSNLLRVNNLFIHEHFVEQAPLDRVKALGSVKSLNLYYSGELMKIMPLLALLGPRGLEALIIDARFTIPNKAPFDLISMFAVAPYLTKLFIDISENASRNLVTPTIEQLKSINIEKLTQCCIDDKQVNKCLPFLEEFVLRSENQEFLYVSLAAELELVLRLLRNHPNCCTRVEDLQVLIDEMDQVDAAVEIATRIAMRSPILKSIEIAQKNLRYEDFDEDYPWFRRLFSNNGIRFDICYV